MILDIKDLSVNYHSRAGYVNALKRISFGVEEGEILGVAGESGSGKSTLAFSVLNLLPLDSKVTGRIVFEGKDIFSLNDKELEILRGGRIGLIFQEPASAFNPVLSVGYQFQEILINKLNIRSKEERRKIIFDSFKKVRLPEPERILKSYPHQLSGGQLQRVAIAIAISQKPTVLIADEPTSSLDVTIESQIAHLFKELNKTLNLTIIFITHNLDLIKVLADRVVVFYKGEVREVRSKDELFASPQDDYTKSLLLSFRSLEE